MYAENITNNPRPVVQGCVRAVSLSHYTHTHTHTHTHMYIYIYITYVYIP